MVIRVDPRGDDRSPVPRVVRRRIIVRDRGRFGTSEMAKRRIRAAFALPVWMYRGYNAANAGDLAAAVAYNALVAIIPMLLLMVSVGGLALKTDDLLATFIQAIFWALPAEDTQDALDGALAARRNSPWIGAISFAGFAWVGANFVSCLARCMNRVYGVPNRRFVHQRTRDFLVVVAFGVLFLLVSIAATLPSFFVGKELDVFFSNLMLASGRAQAISYGVALLSSMMLFLVVYRIVPNAGQRLRDVWPGILTAAFLLVLLLQVFPVYLRMVGGVNRYGACFGFIPLLVGWFYVLAHVLLFGTYVNASFRHHCRKGYGIGGFPLPGCPVTANLAEAIGDAAGQRLVHVAPRAPGVRGSLDATARQLLRRGSQRSSPVSRNH